MYKGIFYTHLISVNLFLLIYLIKTILLLANKEQALLKFTKAVKIPEMIVSTLFLLSGIYMLTQIPSINTLMVIKLVAVFVSIPLAVIGFKKRKKLLALIAFILIVVAYGLAEMSKKRIATANADIHSQPHTDGTPGVVDGKAVFESNCRTCHGEDGQLGLMGSPNLAHSTLDMNAKIDIIRNGKGAMQAFGGILTDEEIQTVAAYVESLKK
jgi:uncharacterized membrane protein SirB2